MSDNTIGYTNTGDLLARSDRLSHIGKTVFYMGNLPVITGEHAYLIKSIATPVKPMTFWQKIKLAIIKFIRSR